MKKIKVMVSGANGRMGRQVVQTVVEDLYLEYVGGVDTFSDKHLDSEMYDYKMYQNLEEGIISEKPDVIVDFTTPESVFENVELSIKMGVRPVVGTTGLSQENIKVWTCSLKKIILVE